MKRRFTSPTVAIDFELPNWWEQALTLVSEHHDSRERAPLLVGLEQGKVVEHEP